jgi:hypothetical protein
MLGRDAKRIAFRLLTPKPRSPYEEVWHLWTVRVPRRSITGRLLRGTVLRRQHNGRWIYKKYIEVVHGAEFAGAVELPIGQAALAADRTAVHAGERTEPLLSSLIKNAPEPPPSLTRAQKSAVVAIFGVLILLSAYVANLDPQTVAPTANCDHVEHCGLLDPRVPKNFHTSQPDTKNSVVIAPHPSLDSKANESGVVKSKTGARAHVGIRYAKRFQAYIDDLENNYGARVLFMGGIRPGHCSSSSQHPCGKAMDVCQLRRGVVDARCHLPGPGTLAQIAASHDLFEGGRWCNSDYGHAQVDMTAPACGDRRVHTVRHRSRHNTAPAALAQAASSM